MNDNTFKPSATILLLDDEPSVLFALKLLLKALGFSVVDFNIGQEALDFLKSGKQPDLFLCDLKMPQRNGLEVLSEVRNVAPTLPFVLMSAHATDQEVDEAYRRGANGFLAKPFSGEEIRSMVKRLAAPSPSAPQ